MDLSITLKGVILATVSILALYYIGSRQNRKQLPQPPGPNGLPVIGNLLDIIKAGQQGEQHLLFEKWARQYGDLYKVKLGPVTQFMINSDHAVKQVFDKSAAVSANRPTWLVSRDHICNSWNMLTLDANTPRWKQQRKVTWNNIGNISSADAGLPGLYYETLKFLHEVANDGKTQVSGSALWASVMRYTYSNFATQMFGMDIPSSADPAIHYIHETGSAQILATMPGSQIVDVLPFLDNLPLFLKPWERHGRERFQRDLSWCVEKIERVKHMEDPSAVRESLIWKMLNDENNLGFSSPEEGAYLCLMLTIAASDTSQVSTWSFIEAMLEYPEVQEKARRAIEEVVGDRIPDFSDYDRIPYVKCLVKETLRWRPPVGLGQAHITTADITYNGMRIPKGSRICLNGWAIQHDPKRHPDPNTFSPERYQDDHTSVMQSINSTDVTKRDHFAFGAGRRVCSGYNVAERSLAVAMMRILWAFEIKPSADAKLPLDIADWRGNFPGLPGENMPVNMVPRSVEKVALINRAFAEAESERPGMVGISST